MINPTSAFETSQLTNDSMIVAYPHWSPDGNKIIYLSYNNGSITSDEWVADFWIMDVDGSNKFQLASGDSMLGLGSNSPLSPDGTKLLFISNATGNHELWVMDVDGSNKKQLTHGAHLENNLLGLAGRWSISWSPDGSQIVYMSASSENRNVWETVEIDGKEEPMFNISNTCQDSDIWIIDSDGTNNTKITDNGKQNLRPRFQPNGEKIAFLSNTSGNGGIWIMNKDGSNKTQIEESLVYDIEWSPDGTKIVYVKGDHENYTSSIWVMDADGTNKTPLTNNSRTFKSQRFPKWSPDETKIAFNSGITGEYEIWIMNADGSGQTKIGNGIAPQWSPKGDRIAFTEINGDRFTTSVIILDENLISAPSTIATSASESTPEDAPGFSAAIAVLSIFMICTKKKKRI